jgi:hypothetical protein
VWSFAKQSEEARQITSFSLPPKRGPQRIYEAYPTSDFCGKELNCTSKCSLVKKTSNDLPLDCPSNRKVEVREIKSRSIPVVLDTGNVRNSDPALIIGETDFEAKIDSILQKLGFMNPC